ncbi:fumarylacetoacetate hydrolase family protein [soil metagenome]
MKYASFIHHDSPTWGVADAGHLYDLGPSGLALAPTLKAAVESGVFGNLGVPWKDATSVAESEIAFLPAITDPAKILCIGVNYRSHRDETGRDPAAKPTVFTRFADTQMGHLQPAVRPFDDSQFDYEGELALVIGKPAFRVSQDDAYSVVAGYGIYNDFSVRDWQRATTQWTPGKNFPSTGGFGPYLVPASDIPDVTALNLETRVNGDVRQSAVVADLLFDIPEIIAHVTAFTALSPGDVIVTGTPGGVGMFMDPKGLITSGDVVEVEITGLGTLTNTVSQG